MAPICPGSAAKPFRPAGVWLQPGQQSGVPLFPGIKLLTGFDLKPFQTEFCVPELADPYVTLLKDSAIISGTAQYYLRFRSPEEIGAGGPYQIVWNDYYYPDGTEMEGDRYSAHSWDMKPSLWTTSAQEGPRLWDSASDAQPPTTVWYGGHMRPRTGERVSRWPDDNYSRDVFAFEEREPGKWFSREESIFAPKGTWPRVPGNYLGHRYGHQIVMISRIDQGQTVRVPSVFYEEVTEVRPNGAPAVTRIFMDEMASPFLVRGKPVELVNPINPSTGKPYPSTVREDGSVLVEGPLYFRFLFEGEAWEAIGFSAGSYYAHYPAAFASRKVVDGLQGKPYQLDLSDDGTDLHDAGAELGAVLNLTGGPGRPSVIVGSDGMAIPDAKGALQILVHGYARDNPAFRVVILSTLRVERGARGGLRFRIAAPDKSLSFRLDLSPRPLLATGS